MTAKRKYRAVIIGGGRIGVGNDRFAYSHLRAYKALRNRIELVGIVETDSAIREYLKRTYGIPVFSGLEFCPLDFEVVSICTPPCARERLAVFLDLQRRPIKGVWCEKPYLLERTDWPWPVQVNYIRRFDPYHVGIKPQPRHSPELFVIAKADIHTVCHFTDLARMWHVPVGALRYYPYFGPCSYLLRSMSPCGMRERHFPLGGVKNPQGCMNRALANLLDVIEGKAELISPVSNAVESEKWAGRILASFGDGSSCQH